MLVLAGTQQFQVAAQTQVEAQLDQVGVGLIEPGTGILRPGRLNQALLELQAGSLYRGRQHKAVLAGELSGRRNEPAQQDRWASTIHAWGMWSLLDTMMYTQIATKVTKSWAAAMEFALLRFAQ